MNWRRCLCLGCLVIGLVALGAIGWGDRALALEGQSPIIAIGNLKQDFTYSDLSRQDLSEQNLVGASLAAADARDADFTHADLSQTILTKGVFLNAKMIGVNLSKSFADRVIFDGADLTDAVVVDAIMTSSTFNDAIITGADFSGTILDRYQIVQLCKYADGVNSVTGVSTRDGLGCR